MAVEVAEFLRNKFSNLLHEAGNDLNGLLKSRFGSIDDVIRQKMTIISSSTASELHVLLYDLIDALYECRVFAYQHKPTLNKGLLLYNALAEWWFTRKMKNRLREIKDKLQKIDGSTDSSPPTPTLFPSHRQTYPAVNESDIVGFGNEVMKIGNFLIEENNEVNVDGFTAIGIVGMGGAGKTALAQKVFDSTKVKENFPLRIWVSLWETFSEEVDVKVEVVKYILEAIGHDVDEFTSDLGIVELLEHLSDQLRGKRYLIVLDDVWHIDEWYADLNYRLPEDDRIGDRFSHGLPKGSGGAIIVTSRLEHVARKMVGGKNLVSLDSQWDKETCWSIFSHYVDNEGKIKLDDHIVEKMRDEIKEKCDGLPLAAKTLAEIIPFQIPKLEK
uniref:NB-ARC domain-containing protein n=1 Tax=Davidia involucrata TaxID=16924 RepID=A0A5B7AY75_DAVIN